MFNKVRIISPSDIDTWDAFVESNPLATFFHRFGWQSVIRKTYGHDSYYLVAEKISPVERGRENPHSPAETDSGQKDTIPFAGILPLIHLHHPIFGNKLVSMPFVDMGGVLADDEDATKGLVDQAILLAQKIGARSVDLRQAHSLSTLVSEKQWPREGDGLFFCHEKSGKVRMVFKLPASSELLMQSFKAKLRSQIRKPIKEGLKAKVGGIELLEEFYKVFSIHMRDLGSPVHSKKLMENLLLEFPGQTRVFIVFYKDQPIACSFAFLFRDQFMNPWASALRKYSHLSPNMLLYWTMLEYACDHGFEVFDFGRSTPGEGTYRFKEQWGAKSIPLCWLELNRKKKSEGLNDLGAEKAKFDIAIQLWKKMPVPLSKVFGPVIRKNIGL